MTGAGTGRHLPPSLLRDKNGSPSPHPSGTPAAAALGRTVVTSGAQASIPGVLCWVLSLPWPSPRSLPHLLLPPFLLSSSCHMALLVAFWTVSSTGDTVYHPILYSLHLADSYFPEGIC